MVITGNMEQTTMNLGEEKNNMIQSLQNIFREYLRVKEEMNTQKVFHQTEVTSSLDTIQNQEKTITDHLESIQSYEEESRLHKKQLSEYEGMIRSLEDKLSDTLKEKGEETQTSNKFNMIRIQADEIANKDREIERLNKLVLNLKTKTKKTVIKDVSGGWSPTKSKSPELTPLTAGDEGEGEEEPSVIDTILASVGEAIQKLEPDFEEEVIEDVEDVEEEPAPETEVIVSRKKEYLIVKGDEHKIVYEKDDDKMGPKVGTWAFTKSGRRKVILDE